MEDVSNSSNPNNSEHRRLCGDWSSKLKLLRHISSGARLKLKFSSDYSHHFGGFKARVSIESSKYVLNLFHVARFMLPHKGKILNFIERNILCASNLKVSEVKTST